MNTKRLFIALNLPYEVRDEIYNLSLLLANKISPVNWVRPSGYHLTLAFLGETGIEGQEKIKNILDSIGNKYGEIKFELSNIAAFPDKKNPRVIFVGLNEINGHKIFNLQNEIARALADRGLPIENKKWTPHITLGRVKSSPIIWSDIIDFTKHTEFRIASIELMESRLGPSGAVYSVVKSVKL